MNKEWKRGIGNDAHDIYDEKGRKVGHIYSPTDGTMIVRAVNAFLKHEGIKEEDFYCGCLICQGGPKLHD